MLTEYLFDINLSEFINSIKHHILLITLWFITAVAPICNAQLRYEEASWGLRSFSGEKYQNFDIIDGTGLTASFTPTSKNLAGIGYSHQYFNVDLGIRLKTDHEDQTQRFDLQSSALYKGHYVDLIAKRYQGFVVTVLGEPNFREDILSNVLGINYIKFKNTDAIDIKAIKSGRLTKKSKGSLAYGGFLSYNNIKADSAIVPSDHLFSPETRIERLKVGTVGLHLGYFHRLWVADRIYLFGAIITGLGMNFGSIQAIDDYRPTFSPSVRLQAKAGAGYVRDRYAISFISDQSAYVLRLNRNSVYAYGIGALKLAFTWRFYSENALHDLLQKNKARGR